MFYYHTKSSATRYCRGMLSVRPSVCNFEVWSYRLEILENNLTDDWPNLSSLCRLRRHGSTPKGTPYNFSRNRSWVRKIVDFRHLSRRIPETVQDSVQFAIDY